jgi:hypothetical protein
MLSAGCASLDGQTCWNLCNHHQVSRTRRNQNSIRRVLETQKIRWFVFWISIIIGNELQSLQQSRVEQKIRTAVFVRMQVLGANSGCRYQWYTQQNSRVLCLQYELNFMVVRLLRLKEKPAAAINLVVVAATLSVLHVPGKTRSAYIPWQCLCAITIWMFVWFSLCGSSWHFALHTRSSVIKNPVAK